MKNKPAIAASLLLLLFVGGSIMLVLKYVSTETGRDMDDWRARLGIMAESQTHSVDDWFAKQLATLHTLANNPLIQLYASQSIAEDEKDETVRGQLGHLRNLINATAERSGAFTPISRIRASLDNTSYDGIAIFNTEGLLLATRYFPIDDQRVSAAFEQVSQTAKPTISEIFQLHGVNPVQGGESVVRPRIIIAVPVNSVQSLDEKDIRAVVIAVIDPDNGLYPLLNKQWATTNTEESLLVRNDHEGLHYLSPLEQGLPVFFTSDDSNAAAQAAGNMSGLTIADDYRGVKVLSTARPLQYSAMTLVQKIDEREALSESNAHRQFILTTFLLVVFVITLMFIAIWRHATSIRLEKAKSRLEARTALLNAVGDSINDHIFLLDHRNRLVFINDALARNFSVSGVDVRGKALNHIFSNEITDKLLSCRPADISDEVRNREMRLEMSDRRHDYHVSVVPLRHSDYNQSHLYVMHDITELKDAEGQHHRMLDGIIATLVQAIDRHDPHCEFHSARTREVAVAIAGTMGMPRQRIEALDMAALLANIGKLFIPSSILTNTEPLTKDEERLMHENVRYGVDILKDLEFDGPVIEFVSQKSEYLDGSGYPKGLSGDQIAQESRILAVANAFVAMTSARAYRSGMPIKQVLDILISEADTRYDRHVIAALFHVAENHSDWHEWQQVRSDGS